MRLRPVRLVVPLVLAALAVVGSHTSGSQAAPVCHLAGSWSQSTPNVGSSTWVITADGKAQEYGLGNARGTATLGGNTLTINWAISENFQGVYRWSLAADCSGTGTLTYTKLAPGDPRAGQSYPSTVKGPAPTEPSSCTRAAQASCPVPVARYRVHFTIGGSIRATGAYLAGSGTLRGARTDLEPTSAITVKHTAPDGSRYELRVTGGRFIDGHPDVLVLRMTAVRSTNPKCPAGSHWTMTIRDYDDMPARRSRNRATVFGCRGTFRFFNPPSAYAPGSARLVAQLRIQKQAR